MARLTNEQKNSIKWAKSFRGKQTTDDLYRADDGSGVSAIFGYWMAFFATTPYMRTAMPGEGTLDSVKQSDKVREKLLSMDTSRTGKFPRGPITRIQEHHSDLKKVIDYYKKINQKLEEETLPEYKWTAPRFAFDLKAVSIQPNSDHNYEIFNLTVAFLPGSGVEPGDDNFRAASLGTGSGPVPPSLKSLGGSVNFPGSLDEEAQERILTAGRAFTAFPDFLLDGQKDAWGETGESGVYVFASNANIPATLTKVDSKVLYPGSIWSSDRPFEKSPIWSNQTNAIGRPNRNNNASENVVNFSLSNYKGTYIDVYPNETYYEIGVSVPYLFNDNAGVALIGGEEFFSHVNLAGHLNFRLRKEDKFTDYWAESGTGIIHLQVNMWKDITRVLGLVMDGVNYYSKNGLTAIDSANKLDDSGRVVDEMPLGNWRLPESNRDSLRSRSVINTCIQCVNLWPWGLKRYEYNPSSLYICY